MVFVIVLAILTAVAAYGAARPNQMWWQHYAGRVALAREARPGEPEFAHRRLVYLVATGVCALLLLIALAAVVTTSLHSGPQPS